MADTGNGNPTAGGSGAGRNVPVQALLDSIRSRSRESICVSRGRGRVARAEGREAIEVQQLQPSKRLVWSKRLGKV